MNELQRIEKVYNERSHNKLSSLYTLWQPYIYMSRQEKERQLFTIFNKSGIQDLSKLRLLEIGCAKGHKIIDLLQMGFSPENIIGNELIPKHLASAKKNLPSNISLFGGDARELKIDNESLDIVYQSMVFSSILDNNFQKELAQIMWAWIKPGGGVLWYDFIINNPKNKDIRGIPLKRIKELFPSSSIIAKRVTLAPPISRRVTKLHPSLYSLFNALPFLRSHTLCYIKKQKNST